MQIYEEILNSGQKAATFFLIPDYQKYNNQFKRYLFDFQRCFSNQKTEKSRADFSLHIALYHKLLIYLT